ncbi:DMT family transporter [Paucisalibacillus sp. EB02]|uniref:DMT family transporter n=1 Tax=Paucisalibacillus sp. EB02 TaxID=1347087 RepID=UPI0005A7A361|nr:EamA family transporter [Paucisalibacillus sp. EB02]
MHRIKGIIMIIIGSMFWGATGPLIERILETTSITVSFLLTIRLTIAGLFLLFFLLIRKKDIVSVWKAPSWRYQLIIFSVFGMLGVQFTFVGAINVSNAVVATLLQFSAPIFITIWVSLTIKKFPPGFQVIGIIGTLIGLFLLMTNGSLDSLLVSKNALLWGLAVGVAFSFYTLYPARLMKELSILVIVGWAMLIGGILLGTSIQIWNSKEWLILTQIEILFMIISMIVLGTIAFVLFLSSMRYISPVETSILSSVEPLTAMIISVVWFGTMLQAVQLVGVFIMLVFVTILSIGGSSKREEKKVAFKEEIS